MILRMNVKVKSFSAIILSLIMAFSVVTITPQMVNAAESETSIATSQYGLVDDVQDGVILHCWDWSFNNIKEQMQTIAESGYSAIQTSPIQEAKEPTKGVSNDNWWVFYQPKSFKIDNSGESGLGTKEEFEAMCEEAHKYGIKVIVDIVANHTGNDGNGGIASTVISDIKDDPNCYHKYDDIHDIDYDNRYSITHDSMGMLPDLNTENSKIQEYVIQLLKECIDSGADGFRFDAAKHISVPSEGSEYTFWPNVINAANEYATSTRGITLYNYGEILGTTGGPNMTDYTQYMSITENQTSNELRNFIVNGNAAGAAASKYNKGVAANKLVLWAESHDTYSNEQMESTDVSVEDIKKTWAMAASRADASALYYVRTKGWRTGTIGEIGSMDWSSKEVADVNKFHNYFAGETEYLSSSGDIAYNERGTSGVVIVNCAGTSTPVNLTVNKMSSGTYTDQITGNKFTVSNGKISGQIGSSGIAVIYNPVPKEPKATISRESGSFDTETITLTIGLKDAISGTYQIGDGEATTYTGTKVITIGSEMEYGESVTITLTATNGSVTTTATYTYTKIEEAESNVAYLSLPSDWIAPVYCYAYDDTGAVVIENASWPGEEMVLDAETGYYKYDIPAEIKNAKVIFISENDNRYPADMEPGLSCVGKYLYKDGEWAPYVGKVISPLDITVEADSTENTVGDKVTFTATATGGEGPYTYSFLIHNVTTGKWAKVRDNIISNTYVWSASGAGERIFYVEVKDSTGTVARSEGVEVTTNEDPNPLSATSKADITTTVVGGKVTFTATATGGEGPYKYSYIVYNATTKKWARIKDKISSNTYTWKSGSIGTRFFYVDVTDATGKTVRCDSIKVITVAAEPLEIVASTTKDMLFVGETTEISCVAQGGIGSYTYSVVVYNEATKRWHRYAFGTSTTKKWKAGSSGTRKFYVEVKDSSGKVVRSESVTIEVK